MIITTTIATLEETVEATILQWSRHNDKPVDEAAIEGLITGLRKMVKPTHRYLA